MNLSPTDLKWFLWLDSIRQKGDLRYPDAKPLREKWQEFRDRMSDEEFLALIREDEARKDKE